MPTYISNPSGTILPDGEYKFEIVEAFVGKSKAGNEMIVTVNKIRHTTINDYIVFDGGNAWKIDAFRASLGETILPDEEVEVVPSKLIGKTGKCTVVSESYKGKIRNKIGLYIKT